MRAIIRGLWGRDPEDEQSQEFEFAKRFNFVSNNVTRRCRKVAKDILAAKKNPHTVIGPIYIFGEDNYKLVKDLGLDCQLIHNEPYKYNPTRQHWWHKIEIYKHAFEDFDEIVWLDWDTVATKEFPEDFWEVLGKKECFQACLWKFSKPIIKFRATRGANQRTPNGGFVYMNDKSLVDKLFRHVKGHWTDECAYAKLVDEISGGWKGEQAYWDRFEPQWSTVRRSPYRDPAKKEFKRKNRCFKHLT